MVDPVTSNRGLAVPLRGADVGTWDVPVNGNATAIDTMFGGTLTKSLTNANVPLSTADQQSALIKLTGTLTGNCDIQFNAPGFYIVHNACTVGAFYVRLSKSDGTGNKIGAPPGRKVHVYYDGSDMDYVDLAAVGSYWDYAGGTIPAWITACTVAPWLVCDGSTPLIATYPQLAAILGTSYGGNGINTFGLPDLRNRYRIPLDTNQGGFSSRITAGVSGINGQVLGASGGDQAMAAHSHPIIDKAHVHVGTNFTGPNSPSSLVSGIGNNLTTTGGSESAAFTGITGTEAAGTGASGNVPPGIIAGLSFIKT